MKMISPKIVKTSVHQKQIFDYTYTVLSRENLLRAPKL